MKNSRVLEKNLIQYISAFEHESKFNYEIYVPFTLQATLLYVYECLFAS